MFTPDIPQRATLKKARKEASHQASGIKHRLQSIVLDAATVTSLASAWFPRVPIVANKRCGSWYVHPSYSYIDRSIHNQIPTQPLASSDLGDAENGDDDEEEDNDDNELFPIAQCTNKTSSSAYFKSTDGHYGTWEFSKSRLNLPLLKMLLQPHTTIPLTDSMRLFCHLLSTSVLHNDQDEDEDDEDGDIDVPDCLEKYASNPAYRTIVKNFTQSLLAEVNNIQNLSAFTIALHAAMLVDSTRKGKTFPDSFLRTVPIWCATLNYTFLNTSKASHSITIPPEKCFDSPLVMSGSETDQIIAKIPQHAATFQSLLGDELSTFFASRFQDAFQTQQQQRDPQSHLAMLDRSHHRIVPVWLHCESFAATIMVCNQNLCDVISQIICPRILSQISHLLHFTTQEQVVMIDIILLFFTGIVYEHNLGLYFTPLFSSHYNSQSSTQTTMTQFISAIDHYIQQNIVSIQHSDSKTSLARCFLSFVQTIFSILQQHISIPLFLYSASCVDRYLRSYVSNTAVSPVSDPEQNLNDIIFNPFGGSIGSYQSLLHEQCPQNDKDSEDDTFLSHFSRNLPHNLFCDRLLPFTPDDPFFSNAAEIWEDSLDMNIEDTLLFNNEQHTTHTNPQIKFINPYSFTDERIDIPSLSLPKSSLIATFLSTQSDNNDDMSSRRFYHVGLDMFHRYIAHQQHLIQSDYIPGAGDDEETWAMQYVFRLDHPPPAVSGEPSDTFPNIIIASQIDPKLAPYYQKLLISITPDRLFSPIDASSISNFFTLYPDCNNNLIQHKDIQNETDDTQFTFTDLLSSLPNNEECWFAVSHFFYSQIAASHSTHQSSYSPDQKRTTLNSMLQSVQKDNVLIQLKLQDNICIQLHMLEQHHINNASIALLDYDNWDTGSGITSQRTTNRQHHDLHIVMLEQYTSFLHTNQHNNDIYSHFELHETDNLSPDTKTCSNSSPQSSNNQPTAAAQKSQKRSTGGSSSSMPFCLQNATTSLSYIPITSQRIPKLTLVRFVKLVLSQIVQSIDPPEQTHVTPQCVHIYLTGSSLELYTAITMCCILFTKAKCQLDLPTQNSNESQLPVTYSSSMSYNDLVDKLYVDESDQSSENWRQYSKNEIRESLTTLVACLMDVSDGVFISRDLMQQMNLIFCQRSGK